MVEGTKTRIRAVLFDFGGVLAEEGFREGLMAIGRANGLDATDFFLRASAEAYRTGFVTGRSDEGSYWNTLREKAGVKGSDEQLRREILDRFVVRPGMIQIVREVRRVVENVSILSDQTNWLEELDARYGFFKEFDEVFNSYRIGKSKQDPSLFSDVADRLGLEPSEILFIDDSKGHIERARSRGFNAILFRTEEDLISSLEQLGLRP